MGKREGGRERGKIPLCICCTTNCIIIIIVPVILNWLRYRPCSLLPLFKKLPQTEKKENLNTDLSQLHTTYVAVPTGLVSPSLSYVSLGADFDNVPSGNAERERREKRKL